MDSALIQNGNLYVLSHTSHHFLQRLWGKKKVKPVGTGLSLLLASGLGLQKAFHWISQKFVLTGNRVWHHLMLKFLRIMLLQHNLQAELWQNTVLCPDFEFLKFFLRSDWKCRSLSGWKAVKSPWQASKTGPHKKSCRICLFCIGSKSSSWSSAGGKKRKLRNISRLVSKDVEYKIGMFEKPVCHNSW